MANGSPAPAWAGKPLFSKETQAIMFNWKPSPTQRMLDFDFLCGRDTPSVAAIVQPGAPPGFHKAFFGRAEVALPVYGSTAAAAAAHPAADVFISLASFRSAAASAADALALPSIRTVAVIAEGVPEADTKALIASADAAGKTLIGPATVGAVAAGRFRIGDAGGTVDHLAACGLHRPGSVGCVAKSGGMSNELYSVLARATDGLAEGVAIGGDAFPGSSLSSHALRYEADPQVQMIVVLGEIGGEDEYSLAEALASGRITKPVVAWVSGTCANLFGGDVQFGHAGARSGGGDREGAGAKNAALRAAGASVPESFEGLEAAIKAVFDAGVAAGRIRPAPPCPPPRALPSDLGPALKAGIVRVSTNVVCTISDDRGEEPTYGGESMSALLARGAGVADVICLLWLKRVLPPYATRFIELCLVLCADHGPCVSGAHVAIVTARAGKDLVSALAAGLLTIGPRFGGAIDDAARRFGAAVREGLSPVEYVEEMKARGARVPGIGHRIKSKDNRDARVALLQAYAKEHFPATPHLDYASAVEAYTLTKAPNLVLNVDGCIGAAWLDLLAGCGRFSPAEAAQVVEVGTLNGLFVLARSIGLIGHALDQKRLGEGLYRHPWDSVLYGGGGEGAKK